MENIQEIRYFTEEINENEIKLAIVMCTYKREKYVQEFLNSLPRVLKEKKMKESIKAYIIDNACTL